MKLIDDIGNNEIEETVIDEKKNKLFFAMLNGKNISDTITTSMGDFTVKFPKQNDIISIGRISAFIRGGIPASAFDAVSEYEIQKCATLDVMIIGGPKWYENAKKKDRNFSWRNVSDANFVNEVYAKALEFRHGIQNQLAGNKDMVSKDADEENAGDVSADVGDGLFSGASSSIEGFES